MRGSQLQLELSGIACFPLETAGRVRQTVSHGRMFGHDTADPLAIRAAISSLTARACQDLRRDGLAANVEKAVTEGGTSFDEQYKNVNGESGYFAVSLNAYGMTGLPCKRCGTQIKRDNWMNRGSHFCPKCQKLKG